MRGGTIRGVRGSRLLVALAALVAWLAVAPSARADDRVCVGPAECCPGTIVDQLPAPQTVRIGVVLVGLSDINERTGTWSADYYLYEAWTPTPGFTPQTEVVNEVSRQDPQFDTTDLRDGVCVRSRRIRSTLHSAYDLRTFPFDRQRLTLQFSDAEFDSGSVRYDTRPYVAGLDDAARDQLSSWAIEGGLRFSQARRAFRWEPGAPRYDYATFTQEVRRHITFHLTRFFLPLLVIVVVAFSSFWIDPDDLSSQVGVGVTCLLAAIAFQFAEAGTLPEVAYLTLADRVYAACYVAIALALVESVYGNAVARRGDKERARKIDRWCRIAFPAAVLVAIAGAAVRSVMLSGT